MIVQQEPSLSPVQDQPEDLSVKKVGFCHDHPCHEHHSCHDHHHPCQDHHHDYHHDHDESDVIRRRERRRVRGFCHDHPCHDHHHDHDEINVNCYQEAREDEGEGSPRPSSASPHTRCRS